jgi:mannan endo-1,4-beta-mannosidase
MNLPLVVGEFGHQHNGQNVDEDTIMAEAQARGIGWLAWSYSGNSGGTEFLDQTVQFNPNQLTTWGQRVFTGPNGVQATARCATVFTGCGPGTGNPPPAPANLRVTGTAGSSISLAWNASTGATQYQVQRANGACSATSSFTQIGTSSTTSFTNSGLPADTTFCYRVTASNANGTSPPSNTVTGSLGPPPSSPPPPTSPPPAGGCSAAATVQSQWGTGYVIQPVTVTNTGSASISGWQVSFTLPSGHSLAGSWNATLSGTTGAITATNLGYNGNLGPSASTSFGFQVNRPSGNTQTPTGYACTVR